MRIPTEPAANSIQTSLNRMMVSRWIVNDSNRRLVETRQALLTSQQVIRRSDEAIHQIFTFMGVLSARKEPA